mgnify:CR=1 FL=1
MRLVAISGSSLPAPAAGMEDMALEFLRNPPAILAAAEEAAETIAKQPKGLSGFRTTWPAPREDGRIQLSLTNGREWIDLFLANAAMGLPSFLSNGEFALSYGHTGPVDTQAKKQVVERFFELLGSAE